MADPYGPAVTETPPEPRRPALDPVVAREVCALVLVLVGAAALVTAAWMFGAEYGLAATGVLTIAGGALLGTRGVDGQ